MEDCGLDSSNSYRMTKQIARTGYLQVNIGVVSYTGQLWGTYPLDFQQ